MYRAAKTFLVCSALVLNTCATYRPVKLDKNPFEDRLVHVEHESMYVAAAAPSAQEQKQIFGRSLTKLGIQPIWFEIVNRSDRDYAILKAAIDPDYFSSGEVAHLAKLYLGGPSNEKMRQHYVEIYLEDVVESGESESGYVFTSMNHGTQEITMTLYSERASLEFDFFIEIPGLHTDYSTVDFENLYAQNEVQDLTLDELREVLHNLSCCVTNKKGTITGDPINLAFVGDGPTIFAAFVRTGWFETEIITTKTSMKTVKSFIFNSPYKESPISALYTLGRPQDIAFQKARDTIHERNHVRIWLAPYTLRGEPVWLGQISRDIGVRFTRKSPTLTTHKIDPDVDEARSYLIQSMLLGGHVSTLGYVGGVVESTREEPARNRTGDLYFTDGLRAVLFFTDREIHIDELKMLDWQLPD